MNYIGELITSKANSLVKSLATLKDKKGRDELSLFIAEGVKLTREALEAGLPVKYILINKNRYDVIIEALGNSVDIIISEQIKVLVLAEEVFLKISTEKAPQGVICVIKYLDFFHDTDIIYKEDFLLRENEKAIMLCSVRDPSNLGAVIRSSVAFSVDHIILTNDCADIYNPKTVRSAMGSLFRVKITKIKDTCSFIKAAVLNNRRVYAAELTESAISLAEANISSRDIVMIGNEGHGIPREISAMCYKSVYIPISKQTESLNASVAAAIFMWEQSKN